MAVESVFILLLAVLAVSAHDEFTGPGIIGHAHISDSKGEVVIHITAETTGFVGFGISPNGMMHESDMFIGGCRPGGANYSGDYHGVGNTPVLDKIQNWAVVSCRLNETAGSTEIEFSRKHETGDTEEDLIILEGETRIIWSMGISDDLNEGHDTKHGEAHMTLRNFDSTTPASAWNLAASITVLALGAFGSLLM